MWMKLEKLLDLLAIGREDLEGEVFMQIECSRILSLESNYQYES